MPFGDLVLLVIVKVPDFSVWLVAFAINVLKAVISELAPLFPDFELGQPVTCFQLRSTRSTKHQALDLFRHLLPPRCRSQWRMNRSIRPFSAPNFSMTLTACGILSACLSCSFSSVYRAIGRVRFIGLSFI